MRVTAFIFLAISSAFSVSGCGGGSPGGGNPDLALSSIGVSTSDDFQRALAVNNCLYAAHCGSIASSAEKQCESDAIAALKAYPPAYDVSAAVAAKRLKYDPKAAQACIDAFKTAGCTVDQNVVLANLCQATTPLVAVGASCQASAECTAGYCDAGANAGDGCPGTCKAFIATGGVCDPNAPHCGASDFCSPKAKTCTARVAAGTPCGTNARCQSPLFCNGHVSATMTMPEKLGTCGGAGNVGDGCAIGFFGNTSCTPGLYCDDSDAMVPLKCAARLPAGKTCATTTACADGLDCIGLVLDVNSGAVTKKGACAAFLAIGATCDPAVYETGCSYDAACETMAKVCAIFGAADADCSANGTSGSCGNNLYCDSGSLKCKPMVALNGACTPPGMVNGMPGAEPCHDGTCGSGKACALVCM